MDPRKLTDEQKLAMEAMRARTQAEQQRRAERWLPRFHARVSHVDGIELPYRLYVPEKLKPQRRYPIVVFLHGIGECGTDNRAQIAANEGAVVWAEDQEAGGEPCFILAPQCPDPMERDENGEVINARWTPLALRAVAEALRVVEKTYPIDTTRRYLTGLSLGGYGAWMLNAMTPGTFAAVVTCCPACLYGKPFHAEVDHKAIGDCALSLDDRPLWMFHAADDPAVPVLVSREMKSELELNGRVCGRDFFYTEYPASLGYGHNCWTAAYGDETMRRWLLAQRWER